MIHAEFDDLKQGDEVVFEGNDTVYTVLDKVQVAYTEGVFTLYEPMVYLTPDDDNYIRKVGMFDSDVPRMHRR